MNDDPPAVIGGSENTSDGEYAAAFVAGDRSAFAALYQRYAPRIHDFIARTVRDRAAAEDLTQNVFLQAYERRSSLRDPEAIGAWLYRIAHHIALNHVTRTRAADPLDEDAASPSTEPDPEAIVQQRESVDLVWDAAASLEPRQYALIDLSVRKGLTTGEIAQVLDIDPAQASLSVFRAREALGNAVRYLLVARNRRLCQRLAEMVPEGVRQLTPDQRASVDRHLRRCDTCRSTALFLTSPEQLLAATPLLALPIALRNPPLLVPTTSGTPVTTAGRATWSANRVTRALVLGGTALGAAGIVALVLVIPHGGGAAPAEAVTVVKTYQPWVPNEPSGEAEPRHSLQTTAAAGTCDGASAADPGRPAAFRCFVNHAIQDACFDPAPLGLPAPAVLCSSDPTSGRAELVSLTAPLPTSRRNADDANAMPWFLILSDGRHCARLGEGTDIAVLRYQCTDGTQVTEPDRSSQPWTVHDGHYSHGRSVVSPTRVAISTAYR